MEKAAGWECLYNLVRLHYGKRGETGKLVEKQKIAEENKKTMLANTETFIDIAESVKDADSVIKAIPKITNLKRQVLWKGSE